MRKARRPEAAWFLAWGAAVDGDGSLAGSGGLEGPGTERAALHRGGEGERGMGRGCLHPQRLGWEEGRGGGQPGARSLRGTRPGQCGGQECLAASESLRVRRGTGRGIRLDLVTGDCW